MSLCCDIDYFEPTGYPFAFIFLKLKVVPACSESRGGEAAGLNKECQGPVQRGRGGHNAPAHRWTSGAGYQPTQPADIVTCFQPRPIRRMLAECPNVPPSHLPSHSVTLADGGSNLIHTSKMTVAGNKNHCAQAFRNVAWHFCSCFIGEKIIS